MVEARRKDHRTQQKDERLKESGVFALNADPRPEARISPEVAMRMNSLQREIRRRLFRRCPVGDAKDAGVAET